MKHLDPEERKKLIRKINASYNTWVAIFFISVVTYILLEFDAPFMQDEFWQDQEVVVEMVDPDDVMRDSVLNGVHVLSGLPAEGNYKLVVSYCGRCHSYELVTQNKGSRAYWKEVIVWMQETQDLQDLGEHEDLILDYLARYLAPEEKGRRPPLDQDEIEWYEL